MFGARTRLPVGPIPGHGSHFVDRRRKRREKEAVLQERNVPPGSDAGRVLDPAWGCGAIPFSKREDARKIVWGCLFLSRGKQAQVSQKPALSKFSEPPRNAHFLVSMPGISRFLDDFTVAAEPLPASPRPREGRPHLPLG